MGVKDDHHLLKNLQLGMQHPANESSILALAEGHAALAEGRQIHAQIKERGLRLDASIGTALVNMYGSCGSHEDVQTAFSKMAIRNVVSWNATIAAYAQHGHVVDVLCLLEEMLAKGETPMDVTFGSILSSCGHAGSVNEGMHAFAPISDHCITLTVEHNNCTIDLLGRAEWLDEVKQFMANMPFEPSVMSWQVLLGGCRMLADIGLGKTVAKEMFELDPENAIPYILLSNIYASDARWISAADYRILIGENLSQGGTA